MADQDVTTTESPPALSAGRGEGASRDPDAERRGGNLLGGEEVNLQDQHSVRDHLEEWASQFKCRDAADSKAVNEYLGKLQQHDMKPADLVKASNNFLKDIASRGVPEVRETAPGRTRYVDYMLEKISVATEAFASYKDVKMDDKDMLHKFLVFENVIKAAGPPAPPGPAYDTPPVSETIPTATGQSNFPRPPGGR